jgi:carbonic anhydrase
VWTGLIVIQSAKTHLSPSSLLSRSQMLSRMSLSPLHFHGHSCNNVKLVDNGDTWQVNFDVNCDHSVHIPGSDAEYKLFQFHFHSLSGHNVGNSHYPLEMHMVHADADGHLAVVGSFTATRNSSLDYGNNILTPIWPGLATSAVKAKWTRTRICCLGALHIFIILAV